MPYRDLFERHKEPKKPKINYERIKAMTVDEMAMFMTDIATIDTCGCCPAKRDCNFITCDSGFSNWLESEVREDDR